MLPQSVLGQSSTAREITAIVEAAQALTADLKGRRVRFMMDSYPAFRNLINGGGPVAELNQLVKIWWVWCKANRVTPLYQWVPREENQEADDLSKIAAASMTLTPETERRIRRMASRARTAWPGQERVGPNHHPRTADRQCQDRHEDRRDETSPQTRMHRRPAIRARRGAHS